MPYWQSKQHDIDFVTADTALRLARAFGTSAEFWMNLQKSYELRTAEIELGSTLKSIKPLRIAG